MLSGDNTTRERTLAAALAIVRAKGVAQLSTRRVASELGLTQPALYRHFANKSALDREVYQAIQGLFRSQLAQSLRVANPTERLLRALDTFRAFALERPHYFDMLFVAPPRLPGRKHLIRGTIFQFLVDRVSLCMRAGVLRRDDATSVALTFAALAQGSVLLYRRGRFESADEFTRFYRRSCKRLLSGLR
jgi:AcrR family transcriptional regulator